MNQVEKNEILKQVSSILQFCQEIVSKLSKYPPDTNESIHVSSVSDILTKTFTSDCDSQYEFSERSSSESPKLMPDIYDTISEADVYDAIEEESDKYDAPSPTDKANGMMPSPSHTLLKRWPTFYNITDASVDTWMPEMTMSEDVVMQMPAMTTNVLMHSVLEFLSVVTPSAIYHPNWREEQKRKAIHPEFYNLWTSYDSIFSDYKDDIVDIKDPAPAIRYHSIDLFNVNTRFIENIPKPSSFPIHGVSPDPDFYHKLARGEGEYSHKIFYRFNRHSPFGSDYGYETHIGIVPPPTDPVHGYIWCEGSWKLYAVKPGEEVSSSRRRRG